MTRDTVPVSTLAPCCLPLCRETRVLSQATGNRSQCPVTRPEVKLQRLWGHQLYLGSWCTAGNPTSQSVAHARYAALDPTTSLASSFSLESYITWASICTLVLGVQRGNHTSWVSCSLWPDSSRCRRVIIHRWIMSDLPSLYWE